MPLSDRLEDLLEVPANDIPAVVAYVRKYAPLSGEEWIMLWKRQDNPPEDFQPTIERMAGVPSRARSSER